MGQIIQIETHEGFQPTKAVILGDFAIHVEPAVKDKKTGRALYALSHIPTGRQVDGHYVSPICLRASLRFLASCNWPQSAEKIMESVQCKLDTITAREFGERSSHWAHRRNYSDTKKHLLGQLSA